jgi:hypothetical protein
MVQRPPTVIKVTSSRRRWNRLDNIEVKMELPSNYEELKKSANRTSNWRERLEAVEELGQWKDKQTIDVLTHRMNSDAVYKVQEAAYHKLKEFGEDIHLTSMKKGDLIKGVSNILLRIKKSLPQGHTFEEFKEKLKKMRLDVYDTYEGEKGAGFDKWLENTWDSLSKKQQ